MKKIIFIVLQIFICSSLFAQAPEKINYQAVARNLSGVPLLNQSISVKYEIRSGSSSGSVVYAETHSLTTNPFGLFTAEVGGGTPTFGTMAGIAWGTAPFYLYVEVDGDPMGVTQLLSVPYALFAKESANGPAGLPGKNSLMNITPEPAGTNCSAGGNKIESGLDDNNDGVLQPLEVDYTYFVCDGVAGPTGPQGPIGLTGPTGTTGPTGANGVGIDSTIHNADGTLSIYYSNATSYTTNDLTGPAGANGTTYFAGNGISLLNDTITNLGDNDNDPSNELQVLTISNDTIFLSNGGFVQLPTAIGDGWGPDSVNVSGANISGSGTVSNPLMVIDNDTSATNELQNLSVNATNGNEINITNGTGFFLSQTPPSAANQVLTWDGTNWIAQNQASSIFAVTDTVTSNENGNYTTDSFVFGSPSLADDGDPNHESRFFFDKTNSAFRAGLFPPGYADANVGLYSFSAGAANKAEGLGSSSFGTASSAYGNSSFAAGQSSNAYNDYSFALGVSSNANADNAFSLGTVVNANGANSFVLGSLSTVYGDYSFSFGNQNTIQGSNSIGIGYNITSSYPSNVAIGTNVEAHAYNSVVIGKNLRSYTYNEIVLGSQNTSVFGDTLNWVPTDRLFVIGNGSGAPSDALVMLKNGNTTLKGSLTLTNGVSSYTLPNVDGTNNQVLKTDGAGNVTWQNASTGTTYTAGTAISVLGDSITNLAPDQIITLQSAGATTVTGTYPSFTISSTDNVNDADANPTNELITSFGLNGTSDTIVLKEGPNTFTIPKTSLSDGNGIYSGSGNLSGPTTVTHGANTLTFSGGGMNSTAIFSNGGFLGTNINIEHTGSNGTGIKFRGSTSTTPVDYGYVGASTTGLSLGGGSNSNNLTISTTGNVGINGAAAGGGRLVINHTATTTEPTIHLRETTGNLNRIKFSNNVVANKYFETAAQTNATDGLGAWSVNYFDGSTYRSHIISYGNGNLAIGKGILAANKSLMDVFGTTTLHDTLTIDNGTGSPYSFPVSDGANPGDVLTTDAAGNTYWGSAAASSFWSQTGDSLFTTTLTNKVGIGIANPLVKLHVAENGQAMIAIQSANNIPSNGSNLTLLRARGSLGSEAPIATNDRLGKIEFVGFDGITYNEAASIRAIADESFGSTQHGTHLEFHTTPIGIGMSNEMMRIADNGNVGIGTTNPSQKLHVTGGQIFNNWSNPNGNANLYISNWNSGSGPGYNTGTLGQVTIVTSDATESKYASQNHAGGDGGDKYGTYSTASGTNGSNTGGYFSALEGTSNYGVNSSAYTSGGSTATAIYGTAQGTGTGTTYGIYGQNASSSTGAAYAGYFQNMNSTGSIIYGVRSEITSNSTSPQYAIRADVTGSPSAGIRYGVYSTVFGGTTNWAGYFDQGDVYIQNTLVLPTGAGAGKVLKSDATGRAFWDTLAPTNDGKIILINNTGAVSVPGDIVVIGGGDNSFGLTNTPGNYAVLGVVTEAVANGQPAKVAISGVADVNIDGSSNVVRGQHCITGNANGKANGIAIPNAGSSIGVYLTSTAANGTAKVLLR